MSQEQQNTQVPGPPSPGRRHFLQEVVMTACGAALFGGGVTLYATNASAMPAQALRPPGVLDEETFLGACVRCGLCVRDCPYDTLDLARVGEPVAVGTPYFIARQVACEMCEDIPCVKACPTGALDPELTDIDDARMGLAVLIDQETCLNFLGLRCDVCYQICPLIGEAITLELDHNDRTGVHARFLHTVNSETCTGCGKCEAACVLDVAAIKVLPITLAKGQLGRHYRLGWEEQEKAGKPLLENIIDLPDRMPAGGGLQ
ncbi:MAG: ferredoxin-type protein NapG [Gammaproteobacteria bacterium]|nr:MAG: ferredoxin-type protein NapG [Gammaproteobacteria bacterium]